MVHFRVAALRCLTCTEHHSIQPFLTESSRTKSFSFNPYPKRFSIDNKLLRSMRSRGNPQATIPELRTVTPTLLFCLLTPALCPADPKCPMSPVSSPCSPQQQGTPRKFPDPGLLSPVGVSIASQGSRQCKQLLFLPNFVLLC